MVATSCVVATSFAQCSFNVDATTSVTCRDIIVFLFSQLLSCNVSFWLRPLCCCMMTSCCDSDSFGCNCVGGLLVFISFNFMSRHHDDVATSFASHSFSSVCNLSSTLQLISFFPLIFQVATSVACRGINFFCSAFLQVATYISGRDIISDP